MTFLLKRLQPPFFQVLYRTYNFWQQLLSKTIINTTTYQLLSYKTLRKIYLFKHSNCSHLSLEVAVYLFLSLKWWQSSIFWSVLCRFHSLYNCSHLLSLIASRCHSLSLIFTLCHLLSLIVIRCHSLSLVVIRCHSFYHSLSLVVIHCHSLYHALSLAVTRCTTRLSFYKRSKLFCTSETSLCFTQKNNFCIMTKIKLDWFYSLYRN